MGKEWDRISGYQEWTTAWATEALRILKPGASLLCFGGTRTYHRLVCGLEDAGFIIKDCLMRFWVYGSGFPKAQDLGKMMDKRAGAEPMSEAAREWDGWKVGGIKPAWEPIIWAVKPPEGSYLDNVLRWGVGAVNVDECRIATDWPNEYPDSWFKSGNQAKPDDWQGPNEKVGSTCADRISSKGRFPANLVLSHTQECRRVGTKRVRCNTPNRKDGTVNSDGVFGCGVSDIEVMPYADTDGLETVEAWECSEDCPVRLLDEQSGVTTSTGGKGLASQYPSYNGSTVGNYLTGKRANMGGLGDIGGASRFFYCAKATDRDPYNDHPTLKPTDLMKWLVRLVTREGQIVLDPFAGSGTTGIACVQSGREYILVEQDEHYCEIAERRLSECQMGMF